MLYIESEPVEPKSEEPKKKGGVGENYFLAIFNTKKFIVRQN